MEEQNFKKLLDKYGLGDFSREKEIGEMEYAPAIKGGNQLRQKELDVHGQRVGAAILNVKIFLDDCQSTGIKKASIITGKGTGVLCQAVKELLEKKKEDREIKNCKPILDSRGEVGAFEASFW